MLVVLIILIIAIALYFLKSNNEYWERRGVPGPKPKLLVGNLGQCFLLRKSPFEVFNDIYNQYPDLPIVGVYQTSTPSLLIRDPDLIKEITVRSFESFQENGLKIDKKLDPMLARNPFFLSGEEWKVARAQLTPAFTSGKMKSLYPLLEHIGQELVKFIENQAAAFNGEGYEAKELCMRLTLNNVASCAFGLEGRCFEEENSEFKQIANKFLTPEGWSTVKILLMNVFPVMSKFMSVKITPKSVEDKITNIVSQTLKYREENNIVRNDFLHIMQELKKSGKEYEFTDDDVSAHAAGFIADGYESSSAVMSFMLYELAANPDVQSKLRQEINQNFTKTGLSYEQLQEMPYLDAVLNESLRLHPGAFAFQKICTKDYTYVPENTKAIKKPVVIEKGTKIIIPSHGLHHDPKYFDEPESFKPERFLGANRDNIKKHTFMPFGQGPRACLGQRFGVLQIKTGLVHIIKNYELSVNKKTQVPFRYDPVYFIILPIGGLWLDFKKI